MSSNEPQFYSERERFKANSTQTNSATPSLSPSQQPASALQYLNNSSSNAVPQQSLFYENENSSANPVPFPGATPPKTQQHGPFHSTSSSTPQNAPQYLPPHLQRMQGGSCAGSNSQSLMREFQSGGFSQFSSEWEDFGPDDPNQSNIRPPDYEHPIAKKKRLQREKDDIKADGGTISNPYDRSGPPGLATNMIDIHCPCVKHIRQSKCDLPFQSFANCHNAVLHATRKLNKPPMFFQCDGSYARMMMCINKAGLSGKDLIQAPQTKEVFVRGL